MVNSGQCESEKTSINLPKSRELLVPATVPARNYTEVGGPHRGIHYLRNALLPLANLNGSNACTDSSGCWDDNERSLFALG